MFFSTHIPFIIYTSYTLYILHYSYSPKVHAGNTLIGISLTDTTDPAFGEEDTDERGIVTTGPILDGECQWIRIMFWWIREFQKSIHRNLRINFDILIYNVCI